MSIDTKSLEMLAHVSNYHEQLLPVASSSSSGRSILPLHKTPSLTVGSPGKFNSNTSATKTAERISTFCVDRVVQAVLNCQQARGKTVLQGAQAPSGHQAAHASLQPTLEDNVTRQVIEKILKSGVTPTKTEPWLRSRLGLSAKEIQELHQNHSDPGHVLSVFFNNLSVDAQRSSISGTYYEKRRNATYTNPTESNQLDTALERYLTPFLSQILQTDNGKTPARFACEATKQLTDLMSTFYTKSTNNLRTRIEDIEAFCSLHYLLHEYEKDKKTHIEDYIDLANELLKLKRKLATNAIGTPAYKQLQTAGIDYKGLASFIKSDLQHPPSFIKNPPQADVDEHLKHYKLLLAEAETQAQEVETYNQDSAIENLFILIFGVPDKINSRRAPTDTELNDAVFELVTPTSPPKQAKTSSSRPPFKGARTLFKDQ